MAVDHSGRDCGCIKKEALDLVLVKRGPRNLSPGNVLVLAKLEGKVNTAPLHWLQRPFEVVSAYLIHGDMQVPSVVPVLPVFLYPVAGNVSSAGENQDAFLGGFGPPVLREVCNGEGRGVV